MKAKTHERSQNQHASISCNKSEVKPVQQQAQIKNSNITIPIPPHYIISVSLSLRIFHTRKRRLMREVNSTNIQTCTEEKIFKTQQQQSKQCPFQSLISITALASSPSPHFTSSHRRRHFIPRSTLLSLPNPTALISLHLIGARRPPAPPSPRAQRQVSK